MNFVVSPTQLSTVQTSSPMSVLSSNSLQTPVGETKINKKHWKVYIVLHGESNTVTNKVVNFGSNDFDGNKNFITIGELKEKSKINNVSFTGNLRVFRTAQPTAVFMSGPDSNEELRENYVGNPNFPGFGRRIGDVRIQDILPRQVDEGSKSMEETDSVKNLLLTLQMFDNDNDEIFNERLLTDLGGPDKLSAYESATDFGIWIKENNENTWIKLFNNDDEFLRFLYPEQHEEGGRWKYLKIDVVLPEIIKRIKTIQPTDNIDFFIANCSPPTSHEHTNRIKKNSKGKWKRQDPSTCASGNEVRWLNAFYMLCRRINIFLKGKDKIKNYLNVDDNVNVPNKNQTYLRITSLPWSVIDDFERSVFYKNFICFLSNYKKWIKNMNETQQKNLKNNFKFLLHKITTPLVQNGIAQLTIREGEVDTLPVIREMLRRNNYKTTDPEFNQYLWEPSKKNMQENNAFFTRVPNYQEPNYQEPITGLRKRTRSNERKTQKRRGKKRTRRGTSSGTKIKRPKKTGGSKKTKKHKKISKKIKKRRRTRRKK